MMKWSYRFLFVLFSVTPLAYSQQVLEYPPEDAVLIYLDFPTLTANDTIKLLPGVFVMDKQLRFDPDSPVIEGSGSGFGANATVLDFSIFSRNEADARALSVRGAMTIRNLTIINVDGRVADLRTGLVEAPSGAPVIFENVWFVNNNTVLKSTGGRTAGTPESPMIVKNCVFANGADYPFETSQQAVTLRDTSYALFDHCDFFNIRQLLHAIVDPVSTPNAGPGITINNSILYGANGSGGVDTDDIEFTDGSIQINNSVLWDTTANGKLEITGGLQPEQSSTVAAEPGYVNVSVSTNSNGLDFALVSSSPAQGLGADRLNAGSVAAEPAPVQDWQVYSQ